MTEQHTITPPLELVNKWGKMLEYCEETDVFSDIARWGADQELEACCEYLTRCAAWEPEDVQDMLDLRRPKPPSLKEQALEAAQRFYAKGHEDCTDEEIKEDFDTIRRALEQLDD